MILTIRTDKPEAEIGLYDKDSKQLSYKAWQAHRELSKTIHITIKSLLDNQQKDWGDIAGIVFYEGPGSFTGLRIGASVANALGSSLGVSVVSRSSDGWIQSGIKDLASGKNSQAIPVYGREAHTTEPKK